MGVKIDAKSINVSEGISILDLDEEEIGELRSGAFHLDLIRLVLQ